MSAEMMNIPNFFCVKAPPYNVGGHVERDRRITGRTWKAQIWRRAGARA